MRTQQEILDRIASLTDDALGFQFEVLVESLEYDHALPYLIEGTTQKAWESERRPLQGEYLGSVAEGYLDFAIQKIIDHRGISAGRSVQKLREYAWLLGRDDVVAAMDAADYPQYGAPKVKAFAIGMGYSWPSEPMLERMAEGGYCIDYCDGGCEV